jgi:hypothetical protein
MVNHNSGNNYSNMKHYQYQNNKDQDYLMDYLKTR